MAAIHDLIAQVEDRALRQRLQEELARLTKAKTFGLVFEDHLPELTALFTATIAKGALVVRRDSPLTERWRVLRVDGPRALCVQEGSGQQCQMDMSDLVVVRPFGDPIFPALIPVDHVANGPLDAAWHTLIEADNYHALQLLEYLYAGEVDCIYIDPPYNTGARDWKYNNDYIDEKDSWRHSKWLAMMRRRLMLAKRLLNPKTGVLIVTIDEHEVHHLGMLLEAEFPECARQMVTVVINQKGVAQGRLSRAEEYAFFVFMPEATLPAASDDLLSPERTAKRFTKPRWEWLLRGGTNSRREDRPRLFYPIYVDPALRKVVSVGEPLAIDEDPNLDEVDEHVAWPVRTDGSLGNWRVSPPTMRELVAKGYVKLGGYDKKRKTWTILYLGEKARKQIDTGAIRIVGRDSGTGIVEVEYAESEQRNIKTVWHRPLHDSGNYGSHLLRGILRNEATFSFPKSLYAVRDAIAAATATRKDALIIDFFAGSGTTLHAVDLLNAADSGRRRCILVTNNEVSEEEARKLRAAGCRPGDPEWERYGICQSVTWPRVKYTIRGRRDDGTGLAGDYLTGNTIQQEKPRRFVHIGFVEPKTLTTTAKKKQIIALIDGLPQSAVKQESRFLVLPDMSVSILFDEEAVAEWLSALADKDHITDFYIVTPQKTVFEGIRDKISELLGPVYVAEPEKRPMQQGFPANLEYFRLDFLDKDQVALKRRFQEILPILWLRAGAVGPRPELPKDSLDPDWLIPTDNLFAVLLNEQRFGAFSVALAHRADITHVFLVTDSDDAFHEMAKQISAPTVVQLYRDYLDNFMINKGGDA